MLGERTPTPPLIWWANDLVTYLENKLTHENLYLQKRQCRLYRDSDRMRKQSGVIL